MPRITIVLSTEEKDALIAFAMKQRRDPREQAALIIQQELEKQGFIKPTMPGVSDVIPSFKPDDKSSPTDNT